METTKDNRLVKISDAEYFKSAGLSNSDFRLLAQSPRHLLKKDLFELEGKKFTFGSALHAYVLERDTFYDHYAAESFEGMDLNKNTNKYKDARKAFQESCVGKEIITQDDFAKIERMAYNINEMYGEYLNIDRSEREVGMYAYLDGEEPEHKVLCRGKADIINHQAKVILDLKTTVSIKKFTQSMIDYNYITQSVLYRRMMKQITGQDYRFMFLLVENTAPYMVSIVEMDQIGDEIGDQMIRGYISKWWKFLDHGEQQLFKTLHLPEWYTKQFGYSQ